MNKNVLFYVLLLVAVIAVVFIFLGADPATSTLVAPANQSAVQTSAAVQIPDSLVVAFNAFLVALISAAVAWVLARTGLNLTGIVVPLSFAVSTFIVGLAQGWINLLDASLDPTILIVLKILEVVLAGAGGLAVLARAQNRNSLL